MVNNILLLEKINATDDIEFNPVNTNIVEVIDKYANNFKHILGENRGINVRSNGTNRAVHVDPLLLSHIFNNLISNAIKYSEKDVNIDIQFQNLVIQVDIIDEGIGIPDQEINSLFQPFQRASNSQGVKGTGLGLVIVRDHIKKHGGSISIKSKVNKGTTVSVYLPYKRQHEHIS